MVNRRYVEEILTKHYHEAADGLVDKAPSRLCRGEATERDFFIMKIDLVNSTKLLFGRRKATYLKLAHTYLSTIDKITRDHGADSKQVEYAGDSVIAYFPALNGAAEAALKAACLSRFAVTSVSEMDNTLKSLDLKSKIVLHFDTLLVSNIGPRGDSVLTAIGHPLHRVAKLEKEIAPGVGRATDKFYQALPKEYRKFLMPFYEEKQVPVPPSFPSYNALSIPTPLTQRPQGALGMASRNQLAISLADLMIPVPTKPPAPQFKIEKVLSGYNVNWLLLYRALGFVK